MIRRGLYLQGGGAKGAYQAGVMLALHELGVVFEAVSGTSIGSINGFYWVANHMEKLSKLWHELEVPDKLVTDDDLFIDSGFLLDAIEGYSYENFSVKHWYVNYAHVEEQRLFNRYDDLIKVSKEKMLEVLGFSSRLPLRDQNKHYDLSLYEGMMIDGGMVNNTFIEPLIGLGLDEIVVIPLNNTFENNQLEKFRGRVTIIEPPMIFEKGDTVRTDKKIIEHWFDEGYKTVKKRYSF